MMEDVCLQIFALPDVHTVVVAVRKWKRKRRYSHDPGECVFEVHQASYL